MDSLYKFLICLLVTGAATFTAGLLPSEPGLALLGVLFFAATAVTAVGVSLLPPPPADNPAGAPRAGPAGTAGDAGANGGAGADEGRETGVVKWFDAKKGYGFIIRESGEEIFVHFRSVRGEGRRGLSDGQSVSYRVETTAKGPQAEDVEPAG